MRVLCYDDAPWYGGHEIVFLRMIAAFRRRHDVHLAIARRNPRLLESTILQGLPTPRQIEWASGAMQWAVPAALHFLSREPDRLLDEVKPDVVVVAQGRIELGLAMVHAAKRRKVRIISYIPMAHRVKVSSARPFLGDLRDWWLRQHYRAPDGYITITETNRGMLRERGVTAPIEVVPNRLDRNEVILTRSQARGALDLPETGPIIGVLGRVVFAHKAQDLMVEAFQAFHAAHPGATLCLLGDGPDMAKLQAMIEAKGLGLAVRLPGWRSDASSLLKAFDCLAIPSRFEGVPLVMGEALYAGIPVVGTAADGMLDYLPAHWRFPRGDTQAINAALEVALKPEAPAEVEILRNRVIEDCDLFDDRALAALEQLVV
jgi:glycosyltransferase involved in cell wall biosynthesis